MPHGTLVLVRHGESRFNKLKLFTGWLDVSLTKKGIQEAHHVAKHCQRFNYQAVFTSHLERAHETLLIILSQQKKIGLFAHHSDARYDVAPKSLPAELTATILPVYSHRALNERAYGALQGMQKKRAVKLYGEARVFEWRRGFNDRPPGGESLHDVYKRALTYFRAMILPRLERGQTVLVVSHGNTLRAFIKFLEKIEHQKIPFINLPFGHSLVYEYHQGRFRRAEGEYKFDRPLR